MSTLALLWTSIDLTRPRSLGFVPIRRSRSSIMGPRGSRSGQIFDLQGAVIDKFGQRDDGQTSTKALVFSFWSIHTREKHSLTASPITYREMGTNRPPKISKYRQRHFSAQSSFIFDPSLQIAQNYPINITSHTKGNALYGSMMVSKANLQEIAK